MYLNNKQKKNNCYILLNLKEYKIKGYYCITYIIIILKI